ncbi:MAG: hypothetical protein QOK66_07480 [Nitrososphaeraceae archaeon]|nr:hypothetical protein [Nitrososphaeraceae archaeon]
MRCKVADLLYTGKKSAMERQCKEERKPVSMAIESYYGIGKERVKLLTRKYRRKGRSLFDD